jgi:hypothetical protein
MAKSAPNFFEQFGNEGRPLSKDEIKKIKKWLAVRKEAGRHIDPKTAVVTWEYAQTMDPYGIDPNLPEEMSQIGREYFARAPGSKIWVHFNDLPLRTARALVKMYHYRMCSFVVGGGRARWNPPVTLKGGKVVTKKAARR